MIDISKIKYRLVVMTESKKQYNIKEFVEDLGWEENDGDWLPEFPSQQKMKRQAPVLYHPWQSRDVWSAFLLLTAP